MEDDEEDEEDDKEDDEEEYKEMEAMIKVSNVQAGSQDLQEGDVCSSG